MATTKSSGNDKMSIFELGPMFRDKKFHITEDKGRLTSAFQWSPPHIF